MFGSRPSRFAHTSLRSRGVHSLVAVALLALLAACSGSTTGSATSAPAGPANAAGIAAPAAGAEVAAKDAALASKPGGAALPATGQALVRKASLQLVSDTVDATAAKARSLVQGLGGRVVSEVIHQDPTAASPSTNPSIPRYAGAELTFAVPAASLDAALDGISALGEVRNRSSSSEDVTATLADTEGRIATAKASIERVRALMSQTQSITQIVDLEAALTAREADLEALQRTLKALSDQVAMSTVSLTISPAAAVATEPEDGFLAGLAAGWKAFLTSAKAVLTLLGMTLPFLVLAAALAWGFLRWRRWVRARQSTASTPSTPPTAASHPAYPASARGADPEEA